MPPVSASTPKTILLRGDGVLAQREAIAATGSTIIPGDLVERSAADEVQEHSTSDGTAAKLFAVERVWQESDAGTAQIDDAYAADDTVIFMALPSGAQVYARLAASSTIAAGDYLSSAGDGTLQALGGTPANKAVVAQALEAVTTTTAILRIRVEVV